MPSQPRLVIYILNGLVDEYKMTSENFTPIIDSKIWEMFPEFFISSIVVTGASNAAASDMEFTDTPEQELIDAHLQSWADAYREFGEKHKKTPSSAYALIKRYEKTGEIPVINPIVDLYNRISIEYGIPAGGEDIDKYQGVPTLKVSDGTDPFETTKSGEVVTENPRAGEIIWRDNMGVTCRRWNWRQGPRTRIDEVTKNFWFVLEALPPFDAAVVKAATMALIDGIREINSDAQCSAKLIFKDGEEYTL